MVSAEFELKISTINHIVRKYHFLHDTILIHEFSNGKCGARADIALRSNNLLYAFEVKSAKDSLRRLDKQIEIYKSYFDHVVIVADEIHINNAAEICKMNEVTLLRYQKRRITTEIKGRTKRIPNSFIERYMISERENIKNNGNSARIILNKIINKKYHQNIELTARAFERKEITREELLYLNPHFANREERKKLSEIRENKWNLFAQDITNRQTNHLQLDY
ncbi:sce7726 family protein [Rhizobium sp. BK602]|uniref:sce7726 family protein n=1 Tax=Rhizobium sp. BK602 TaxID=2586986 RepID=UPI001609D06D|nr:sce7726 family protein [Rhizobium sp. BK602]MBB3607618.1 hypothetical protein [Rhizobium sp. BK602]